MREKLNLNGHWKFRIDPTDEGIKNNWYDEGLPSSTEVTVPHIWQREKEWVHYCGTAWYEKSVTVPVDFRERRIHLCFGAVDLHATVWVNGVYIGEHEGGFSPFEFDVTDQLHDSLENKVTVRVFDPSDNAEIPIGKQGSWYTRVSGIWQDVYMEARSNSYVKHAYVVPNIEAGLAEVLLEIEGNGGDDLKAELQVTNHLDSKLLVDAKVESVGKKAVAKLVIPNIVLWSPEQPHLYDLTIHLRNENQLIDQYQTYFGMRKIEHRDGQLLLNGKPLFIRGALDQAYYPKTIYTAPNDEWIRDEIQKAKEMGFNLLRKHIKAEIPKYLYWADRLGMLIWSEPPNYVKWTAQSKSRFENELFSMISRDFNRPSILIWSIFNEEWGLEWDLANDVEKQEYVVELYDRVKRFDSTRLICDNSGWAHVKTDINDYHRYFTVPEQMGFWCDDLDRYMIESPERNFVKGYPTNNEPIIISEFGMWGLPNVQDIIDYYGEEPAWFRNLGDDTHREDFKQPLTAFKNFREFQIDKVFSDLEDLAVYSQARMYRGVKALIEEMRKRPQINGYVVTEFTDVEWETNGWMDYTRSIKRGFDQAKNFNGSLVVMADVKKHNYWSGEEFSCDVFISNHDMEDINGQVDWEISGTELCGSFDIEVGNAPFIEVPNAISFVVPEVECAGFYELRLRLTLGADRVVHNDEELTFSPFVNMGSLTILPYKMDDEFSGMLVKNRAVLTEQLSQADVVVTSTLDAEILHYYRNGGKVLFLAEEGDGLLEKGSFTFRKLSEGESWDRTSSFNYVDPSYFEGVPLQKEMGWELEDLFPDYIIPISNYNKLGGTVGRIVYMFGNENITKTSKIISGYFQGWMGQAGCSIVEQESADGRLIVVTWKLIKQYGKHPIATQVINGLVEKLAKD